MADDPLDPSAEHEVDDAAPTDDVVAGEEAEVVAETEPTEPAAATDPAEGTKPAKPAAKSGGNVVRKTVVSKRVTPKGAPQGQKITPPKGATPARTKGDDGEDLGYSQRYQAPAPKYAPGPSPWWVPAIMFGLLIIGALTIMLNYMGVFGEPANVRLVIGLAFILGGIIAATQYR